MAEDEANGQWHSANIMDKGLEGDTMRDRGQLRGYFSNPEKNE